MPLPDLRMRAFVSAVVGACLLTFTFTSAAVAAKSKTVPGDLRVVDGKGRTLAEQTQYTGGAVKLKSDKRADCFGDGTGGSGKRVAIPRMTALAQLADAGASERAVRPLSISDHFDFGLALCGIGRAESPQTGFWYLKVNHVASQVGGDQTPVERRDDVLWYLVEDFNTPTPDELVLKAPVARKPGAEFNATVVSYDGDGSPTPAAGVAVSGADGLTNADGKVRIDADEPMLELTATREGSIPSNTVYVCTLGPDECPAGYAETIAGSKGKDRIEVRPRATTVRARGGDDVIIAKRGRFGNLIRCGAGKDTVRVSKLVRKRSAFKGCERIRGGR